MIQIAIEASKCGMRAIAFKDHWNISATSAYLTQRHIDDMIARGELTHRVEVYGGVGMCFGMRPEYVRVGLQYPNFKMIWFPTFTSYGFWRGAGHPEHEGVRLCSDDGQVLPEVKQIMEMAAEKKVGIGFGHTDFQELLPLARLAKDIGVRATLDHPLLELNKLLLDEMKQLRDLGVYVGRRRRHAGLHSGFARLRHQAGRSQNHAERQSGEADVVGRVGKAKGIRQEAIVGSKTM